MVRRILPVVFKSALIVALFELLGPVADAIGLRLNLEAIAIAISHATAMPYRVAEVFFLFLLVAVVLELARFFRHRFKA